MKILRAIYDYFRTAGQYFALLFLCVSAASASEVTLAWDYPTNAPAGTVFILYATTNSVLTQTNLANAISVNCGTNKQVQVFGLNPGMWKFGAVASLAGVQSDLSNILIREVLNPPTNARTLDTQFTFSLTGSNAWPKELYFKQVIVP